MMADQEQPHARVSSIFIYPIKSCRGIPVPQAPITSTGFRWDRQWLVVNSKGRAYTQRVEPRLALVEVKLPDGAFDEDWKPVESSNLVIQAPGMDILKVPLYRTCEEMIDGVSVWEWTGSVFDEGAEASKWFSDFLGKPCRLVRFNSCVAPIPSACIHFPRQLVAFQVCHLHACNLPTQFICWLEVISVKASESRPVDPDYAQGYKTMFADGYPFLLISQGSLDALNELLGEPVSINRFRPNILVDGCEPFSEDLWKAVKLNKLTFHGVKLCSRCKMPTINQENGIAGVEPTETLKNFRSDRVLHLKGKHQGKVYFGQNLVCKESLTGSGKGKVIKVGDPVLVLEKLSSCADAPV